mmetsp:Transcript_27215/g.41394  ORF Transcript_27215/g.41394 Transcript_27215/m.41394 type:complete len:172 (-) Transcript_27215:870-1385(-)
MKFGRKKRNFLIRLINLITPLMRKRFLYNLEATDKCPSCRTHVEAEHHFLRCPNAQRRQLLKDLNQLRIGPDAFMVGMLHTQWVEVQEDYLKHTGAKRGQNRALMASDVLQLYLWKLTFRSGLCGMDTYTTQKHKARTLIQTTPTPPRITQPVLTTGEDAGSRPRYIIITS